MSWFLLTLNLSLLWPYADYLQHYLPLSHHWMEVRVS